MHAIRAFFRCHRSLALALVLLALAMKALVPAGFMPAAPGKVLSVVMCDGQGAMQANATQAAKLALPDAGKSGESNPTAKSDSACPYGGLNAALDGTDALLAAALLLFILALGFAPATIPALRRADHTQPPLRGPPAFA